MIGFENVSVSYFSEKTQKNAESVSVLKNVSFELQENSVNLLLGASGAGKTTILKLLAGIETSDSKNKSTCLVSGKIMKGNPVGFVFQSPNLIPWLSVLDNVALPLFDVYGKIKARKIAKEFIDKVALTALYSRLPSEISGGQAQRVALARAFAWIFSSPGAENKLLLLDEPFQSQDIIQKEQLEKLLETLLNEFSCTVLTVSHDKNQINKSDKVFLLENGTLNTNIEHY